MQKRAKATKKSTAKTRLPPKPGVLRRIFLLSGNRCAYPGCVQALVDDDGDFVGEVCHIEAAEPGGPRYNAMKLDEDRRHGSNLILLCRNHHKKTDNTSEFSVEKLQSMKKKHEDRFLNIELRMAASMTDLTDKESGSSAKTLHRLNDVLGWNHSEEELRDLVGDLQKHVELLQTVPILTREFLAAVAKRIDKMRNSPVVDRHRIGTHDIENALNLSPKELRRKGEELEQYGIGCIDEHESYGPMRFVVSIVVVNDWPIWISLAEFSRKTGVSLETFWRDLDFSSLDA